MKVSERVSRRLGSAELHVRVEHHATHPGNPALATNASSGSTPAAFEYGAGTTLGDDDASSVTPPSNVQVCSRL